jgi:hypothetical protein
MNSRLLIALMLPLLSGVAALAGPYEDLVAKGYRWVSHDGPYACVSPDDLRHILADQSDRTELQMVDNLRAYFLVRGTIVQVVKEDPSTGMSQIQGGQLTSQLWTMTKFLSKVPVRDRLGQIEQPINPGQGTPSPTPPASPAPSPGQPTSPGG